MSGAFGTVPKVAQEGLDAENRYEVGEIEVVAHRRAPGAQGEDKDELESIMGGGVEGTDGEA